jgi:hypothetical protein
LEISPLVTNTTEMIVEDSRKALEAAGVTGVASRQAVIKVKTEVMDPDDCCP